MTYLLCKLPRWLMGGHKWRRLTVKERMTASNQAWAASRGATVAQMRKCDRCPAERIVRARKTKTKQEMTNE